MHKDLVLMKYTMLVTCSMEAYGSTDHPENMWNSLIMALNSWYLESTWTVLSEHEIYIHVSEIYVAYICKSKKNLLPNYY